MSSDTAIDSQIQVVLRPLAWPNGIGRDWPGVVVSDIRMQGMDGLELLDQLHEQDPDLPVLLITGHGDVPLAVKAMRAGAYDFLEKPFASDAMLDSVASGTERPPATEHPADRPVAFDIASARTDRRPGRNARRCADSG